MGRSYDHGVSLISQQQLKIWKPSIKLKIDCSIVSDISCLNGMPLGLNH